MTGYHDLLVKKANGFRPPTGRGRCTRCGFHTPTQRHRDGCPDDGKMAS